MFSFLSSELATYRSEGLHNGNAFSLSPAGTGTCPLSCSRAGSPQMLSDLTIDDGQYGIDPKCLSSGQLLLGL